MVAYPFYAQITDVHFVDEITPIVMTIFHIAILLPMCAYAAECAFASSSRVPSGPAPIRSVKPPKLTFWTGFLLVVPILGMIAVFIVTYMMHGGTVVMTSPICYVSAGLGLLAVGMLVAAIRSPNEVNRYFDRSDNHFQQLITLPN